MSHDLTVSVLPTSPLINAVQVETVYNSPGETTALPIIPQPQLRIGFLDTTKGYSALQVYYHPTGDGSSFLAYSPVLCLFRLKKRRKKSYFDELSGVRRVKERSGKWHHPVMMQNPVLGVFYGPNGQENTGQTLRQLTTEWAIPNWTPRTALPGFDFNPLPFYTYDNQGLDVGQLPIFQPGSGTLRSTSNRKGRLGVNAFFHFRIAITDSNNQVLYGPPSDVLRTFPAYQSNPPQIRGITMSLAQNYVR